MRMHYEEFDDGRVIATFELVDGVYCYESIEDWHGNDLTGTHWDRVAEEWAHENSVDWNAPVAGAAVTCG